MSRVNTIWGKHLHIFNGVTVLVHISHIYFTLTVTVQLSHKWIKQLWAWSLRQPTYRVYDGSWPNQKDMDWIGLNNSNIDFRLSYFVNFFDPEFWRSLFHNRNWTHSKNVLDPNPQLHERLLLTPSLQHERQWERKEYCVEYANRDWKGHTKHGESIAK